MTALDFTSTAIAAGGGELPTEFDGVDILPRLTGQESTIHRTEPMFWDFFEEQAVRMGDWKLWRNGSGDRLFKIADDPYELNNVIEQQPQVAAQLASKLDDWVSTLLPHATADLAWDDSHWRYPLNGAPAGVGADPRYLVPYKNPKPTPYPTPMTGKPIPHGKGNIGAAPSRASVAANGRPKRTSPARDFGRMFQRLDENNDGFVTLREFIGDRREKSAALTKMFKKRDANNDSRLTAEEIDR